MFIFGLNKNNDLKKKPCKALTTKKKDIKMRKKLLTVITGLFILAGTGLVMSSGLTAKDFTPCCNAVELTAAEKAVLTGAASDCEGTKTATAAKSGCEGTATAAKAECGGTATAGEAKAGCGDTSTAAVKSDCEAPASAGVSRSATAGEGVAGTVEKAEKAGCESPEKK